MSVRFLGRRVYLGLAVTLACARRIEHTPTTARMSQLLEVPLRTLQRWRAWWRELFPVTALWQGMCAHFMPPVATGLLPSSLLERFGGVQGEPMMRFLLFLSPVTVGHPITLRGGR